MSPRALRILAAVAVLSAIFAIVSTAAAHLRDSSERDLDLRLQKVIALYGIRPLEIRRFEADPRFILGQDLFFDPVLSGDRDVSCATCHLLQYGLSDGLPRSIGVHGEGFGSQRHLVSGVQVHPRKALDLWNRDNNAVSAFFWDGHVEVINSRTQRFRSPLGAELPPGFQNAMAVQAVFPLTVTDEMLGSYGERSKATLPSEHANQVNDLIVSRHYATPINQMHSVHAQLLKRLLGLGQVAAAKWQLRYRNLFEGAYNGRSYRSVTIADVGNALAHFEELAFAANAAPWDRYVAGDSKAISDEAKQGAILFYGKARCAACHQGQLFSDFKYHSIGVFSKITVDGKLVDDYGRGAVTGKADERYKFRTPPLRNVTKFSPYFHDGSSANLSGAIRRHLNPLARSGSYLPDGSFAMTKSQIASISPVLLQHVDLSDAELAQIVGFLASLESQSRPQNQIVPQKVPSGLGIGLPQ